MQTENRDAGMRPEGPSTVECPSCRSVLTAGLRFCRHCGYRLGEGVEEYAETRRFDGSMPTGFKPAPNPSAQAGAPGQWGAMAPMPFMQPVEPLKASSLSRTCRRWAGSWVMWMVLVLAVLTAGGVVMNGIRRGGDDGPAPAKSFLEVDGFDTADGGGAFIEGLKTSDTSLEKAGLLGGDIITSFDGKPVPNERAMWKILAATPIGKTVEVVYLREGEVKKTTLTTISDKDFRDTLSDRPGGRGFLGVEHGGMERVRVPNTNTYGVQLDDVQRNRPGHIAGLRDGDIVVEFNGKPVRTPGDLRLRIYEAFPESLANVVLIRGGERITIPVKMGTR